MKTLTPEQLLEKMLDNVRSGKNITDGLQKKRGDEWDKLYNNDVETCLFGASEFRLTPRTRNICGFDVPAPEVDEPKDSTKYWHLDVSEDDGVYAQEWCNDSFDQNAIRNGIWLNKEDAIANAKALRGEDPYKEAE